MKSALYSYDFHSTEYLDLDSRREHKEYVQKAYKALRERAEKLHREEKFTVGKVIELLKKTDKNFNYLAIRACPIHTGSERIPYDKSGMYYLSTNVKCQICVLDLRFLTEQPHLIYSSAIATGEI